MTFAQAIEQLMGDSDRAAKRPCMRGYVFIEPKSEDAQLRKAIIVAPDSGHSEMCISIERGNLSLASCEGVAATAQSLNAFIFAGD